MSSLQDLVRFSIWLGRFYTADEAYEWLTSPHPHLDSKTPYHLMATGRAREVEAVLERLETGAFV